MDILILGFTKLKFMPYLSFYLNQIDRNKHNVHIVYWNRDLIDEDLSNYSGVKLYEYCAYMEDGIHKAEKLKYFLGYRKFVVNIINEYKYNLIISLHTLPGLCIIDKLIRNYKKKYILDYRDSTFETNKIFGCIVKYFALNARLVFVSSDAFRTFLPQKGVPIITSHNILIESFEYRDRSRLPHNNNNKVIHISFWGLIRHFDHNLVIIDRLANDPRFELHYYGRAQKLENRFKKYIKDRNINNIFLHGEYKPKDRYEFARCTDLLHNSYNDLNMLLAMGNKYYDGLIFYIPQFCMKGSYMGKRCVQKGVGVELDPQSTSFADDLYEYYSSLKWNDFINSCDSDLEAILEEYEYGKNIFKEILNQ